MFFSYNYYFHAGKKGSSASIRRDARKNSVLVVAETKEKDPSPPSSPERSSPPRLGPGQIKPRGFKLSSNKPVEIKLGLLMTKGQLEVDVSPVDCFKKNCLRASKWAGGVRSSHPLQGVTSWHLCQMLLARRREMAAEEENQSVSAFMRASIQTNVKVSSLWRFRT